jgi:tripartite-type tricarboxylate transporter receptor subunit TctC
MPCILSRRTGVSRRTVLGAGAGLALAAGAAPAFAAPSTSLVVPFTPGASNDTIGRLVAEAVTRRGTLNWIVENKPGAGSLLGTEAVRQARPDGRTLLLCATANMGILPAISRSVRYAVDRDFSFLARIASTPFGLAVTPSLGAATLADFVRLAQARPEGIRIGSSGLGALDYMGASMLQAHFGIRLSIIPYKGMSQVLNDLRAGHIDASIVSPGTARPLVEDGALRMLVVFDAARSAQLPKVPSATELGHGALRVVNWWGIAGPAKLPAPVLEGLMRELGAVLADPAFRQSITEKGFEPAVLTGPAFRDFVLNDSRAWAALAKRTGITME